MPDGGAEPGCSPDPDAEPGGAPAEPPLPNVVDAGFWDRSRGSGPGFVAGGVADRLEPGPVLTHLTEEAWRRGLDKLTDDELIGVLRAARRLASRAAALELAATADLVGRRTSARAAQPARAAEHVDDELAAALVLTRHSAAVLHDLAVGLARLRLTKRALADGRIDQPRAAVIVAEAGPLSDWDAAVAELAVIRMAPSLTTGELRQEMRRVVLFIDSGALRRRKEAALQQARVELWSEPAWHGHASRPRPAGGLVGGGGQAPERGGRLAGQAGRRRHPGPVACACLPGVTVRPARRQSALRRAWRPGRWSSRCRWAGEQRCGAADGQRIRVGSGPARAVRWLAGAGGLGASHRAPDDVARAVPVTRSGGWVRPARRGRFSCAGGHAGRPPSHPVVPDRDRRGGQAGRPRMCPARSTHRSQPTVEDPARAAGWHWSAGWRRAAGPPGRPQDGGEGEMAWHSEACRAARRPL